MTPSHANRYQVQWAAQFAVAAALNRRGYLTSLTLGNAPGTDLLAQSPGGSRFAVEVKGQQTTAFWRIRRVTGPLKDRYYVLAFVSTGRGALPPPRYFVLEAGEVRTLQTRLRRRFMARRDSWPGGQWEGFNWGDALPYEGCWDKFPE